MRWRRKWKWRERTRERRNGRVGGGGGEPLCPFLSTWTVGQLVGRWSFIVCSFLIANRGDSGEGVSTSFGIDFVPIGVLP